MDSSPLQPSTNKLNKRSLWIIGLVVVLPTLLIIVLIFGIVLIVFGAVFFGTKSIEEYKCAMSEVRANRKAIEILGEPMKEGLFMTPDIEINGPRRYVNFSTSITGPKKSGTLWLSSERSAFQSNFMMALETDGNRVVLYNGSYPCK